MIAETCGEDEEPLTNNLYLRHNYMCIEGALVQHDAMLCISLCSECWFRV
jgi:hypothetical protein